MRRLSLSFALLALMLVFAVPAMAVLTLPIADDATTEPGLIRIGGGVTLESDMNMYGARFTYGLDHGIALFGGGGDLQGWIPRRLSTVRMDPSRKG